MELLVILLGEFLFFPVVAALGSFINLGVSFLSGMMLESFALLRMSLIPSLVHGSQAWF